MRIAYDLRRIGNPGIGRYMKNLVEATVKLAPEHEYILIMAPETDHLLDVDGNVRRVSARSGYYSVSEQFELPTLVRKWNVDILHAPHFVVPLVRHCPTVVTIHDVIHLVYPQDIASRVGRLYARWMIKFATTVADRIIAVSEFSKMEMVRLLGTDPSRVRVIHAFLEANLGREENKATIERVRSKYGIQRDYILYMGIFKDRKNHIGLLRSFAALIAKGFDLDLVISGPIEDGRAKLSQIAKELGISDRVVFPGFIPEEDLSAMYTGASVYACPSLYEGFGCTPLESMACGTPVVCHEATSLPEVCGNAALYSDARQPEIFAQALQRGLEDSELRTQLIERGYDNVSRFSVIGSAKATLNLYSELRAASQGERRGVAMETDTITE